MRKVILFTPIHPLMLMVMLFIMIVSISAYTIIIFSSWKIFEREVESIGLKSIEAAILAYIISLASIALSPVNIVVKEFREEYLVPTIEFIEYFGIPVPTPRLKLRERVSFLTVNVGGALIPTVISLFIMLRLLQLGYLNLLLGMIVALIVVSIVTFLASRPIPGVGIVSPMFIPPLTATAISLLVAPKPLCAFPIAYVSGTLGTLIGADILHLMLDWDKIKAQVISIGGAGTFDGIYLTGILSTILLAILILW